MQIGVLTIISVLLVILTFIGFAVIEFLACKNYQTSDCKLVEIGIKALKEKGTQGIILNHNVEPKIIQWIIQHFDGENSELGFKINKANNLFILMSYPSIINKPVPRSPVYYAPTLLTALGILGTFIGISWGLQGVNLNNITDPDALINASTELLSGMKVAFFTSLVGVSTSIVSMIGLYFGAKNRRSHRNKLRKQLSDIAFLQTPERLLSRFNNSSGEEATKSLQSVANSLSGFNANTIGEAIKEAISSENRLIIQELRELKELQKSQETTVVHLVQQLRTELIEPVVTSLDKSAKLTQDASEAVQELKSELGGITNSLTGAVETIQTFQQDTLLQLQQFASTLQGILAEFRVDTKGVMQEVASEINRAVEQSISGLDAQKIAFEESANKASDTFRGIREDLQIALDTQAQQQREMLKDVHSSTESILEQAQKTFEEQSTTLIKVGQEASYLLNEAKDNLLGTLENIDEMLQNTRQTVQQELEHFRLDYQAALQIFFNEQNNLLNETLGEQREGLAQVVLTLQETFKNEAIKRQQMSEQIDSSFNKIKNTVESVHDLAVATGLNSGERLEQLIELSRTIGGEAKRVENAYQSMTSQFNQALQQGQEQLNNYLQKAHESYSNSFNEADRSTAQICEKLNQTSINLMGAANYLVTAVTNLDHTPNHNGNGNGNGNGKNPKNP